MRTGPDTLGAALYPKEAIAAYRPGNAVGVFWVEFGNARAVCEGYYSKGCRLFRIQAIWDKTHGYDIKKNLVALEKIAREIQVFKNAHPDARILISPFCEHNHSAKDMAPVFKKLTLWAPTCEQVNCVWKGEFMPNMINEVHGEAPRLPGGRFIVSADGTDLRSINVRNWKTKYRNAEILFGWILEFNLIGQNDKPPYPAPKDRKKKPSVKDIQNVEQLLS